MRSKLKLYIAIAIIAIGIGNIGYILYGAVIADTSSAAEEVASSTLEAKAAEALQAQQKDFPKMAAPEKIIIPSLGINADVIDVGIAASGNMAVPHSFQEVGWYKYGPNPGNDGSAVMAGHVDNGLALAGVFKRLVSIGVGDTIAIVDSSGATSTFEVIATSSLDYKQTDTSQIFAASGPPTLRLITCEGAWVQSAKTYDHRLVVVAKRVS